MEYHVVTQVAPVGVFVMSTWPTPEKAQAALFHEDEEVFDDDTLVEMLVEYAKSRQHFRAVTDLVGELSKYRTETAIRNAEMVSALEPTIAPGDVGMVVYERISALRSALNGIGRITPQYDGQGRQVGGQVMISLTEHDVAALVMLVSGRLPETVGGR